jgi:hypothetical protein
LNHEVTCLRQGAESWKKLKAQSEEDQRSKLPSAAGGLVFITFIREVMKNKKIMSILLILSVPLCPVEFMDMTAERI